MTNTELTKIREDKKLSKSEFAKLLGVTPMLLGKYEKGTCEIPETIEKKLKDASDAAVAAEIEAKKTVRKAERKAKEAVEAAAQSDEAVATEIEVKKNKMWAIRADAIPGYSPEEMIVRSCSERLWSVRKAFKL